MSSSLPSVADHDRYRLAHATVPLVLAPGFSGEAREGLAAADILVADGRIEAVLPPGQGPRDLPSVDVAGGMVWPAFVDMHTHLDKGHIWDRRPNPDGTFMGALGAVVADRDANWAVADVKRRMDFSLRSAEAHGTRLIRTHLDSPPQQFERSWQAFAETKAAWADRIDLQAVALFPIEHIFDAPYFDALVDCVARNDGLLGGVSLPLPDLPARLERLYRAASDRGLDIDLHVDETEDKAILTLRTIAETALAFGFSGRITVGHCCSLAVQDGDVAAATVEAVARAGLKVVSLPMCNMYLQDRHAGRTPRWRGVTLLHELRAAGVDVAVSSDNTRDPFYAYGDLDPVEVFREAVRILHLDHPLDRAASVVTATPADILRRPDVGRIVPGASADLVIFTARRWSEFLSRPQSDRRLIRAGRPLARELPDYSELDDIIQGY